MRIDAASTPPSYAGAAVAGTATTSSFDLTLTTADGDRVTLSSSTTEVVGAAAVAGDGTGSQAAVTSTESSFSLTVEGSLDRGELRDLRKVLKLLRKASEGHDVETLARRLSRPDMDTVASVSASASTSVTLIGGVLAFGGASEEKGVLA